jgi:hypothetical protein
MRKMTAARFCDALRNVAVWFEIERLDQVLVVGPGTTDPLDCILSILSPSRLFVIEINERAAASMQLMWQNSDIHIMQGDASTLSLASKAIDLTIIRHPDIDRFSERWAAVFAALQSDLCDGGIVLISAYSLAEVAALRDCFARVGMSLNYAPELTSHPVDLQGNDRYLLLGQKAKAT